MAAVMGISMDILKHLNWMAVTVSRDFLYHTAADPSDPCLYTDHIYHRWSSDVRCSSDSYKWTGNPDRTSMTLIMFLNSHLKSKNYGMAGALSVYLFIVSGILCMIVYKMTNDTDPDGSKKAAKKKQKKKEGGDKL